MLRSQSASTIKVMLIYNSDGKTTGPLDFFLKNLKYKTPNNFLHKVCHGITAFDLKFTD